MSTAPSVAKVDQAVNAATGAAPPGATKCFDSNPTFVPPPPYTSVPWYLVLKDLGVIFTQLPYLPYVFLPLNLMQGGLLQDMTIPGMIYQVIAVMITLAILPAAFVSFFTGFPWPVFVVVGTISMNSIMYLIQGADVSFPSTQGSRHTTPTRLGSCEYMLCTELHGYLIMAYTSLRTAAASTGS